MLTPENKPVLRRLVAVLYAVSLYRMAKFGVSNDIRKKILSDLEDFLGLVDSGDTPKYIREEFDRVTSDRRALKLFESFVQGEIDLVKRPRGNPQFLVTPFAFYLWVEMVRCQDRSLKEESNLREFNEVTKNSRDIDAKDKHSRQQIEFLGKILRRGGAVERCCKLLFHNNETVKIYPDLGAYLSLTITHNPDERWERGAKVVVKKAAKQEFLESLNQLCCDKYRSWSPEQEDEAFNHYVNLAVETPIEFLNDVQQHLIIFAQNLCPLSDFERF